MEREVFGEHGCADLGWVGGFDEVAECFGGGEVGVAICGRGL